MSFVTTRCVTSVIFCTFLWQYDKQCRAVLGYINGVTLEGELALLIYWPSFEIAQSCGQAEKHWHKNTTALLSFLTNRNAAHTMNHQVYKLVDIFSSVSITCRFASHSVTAASRCIPGRHGWSRCAGDSNAWRRRWADSPGCCCGNRAGSGGSRDGGTRLNNCLVFPKWRKKSERAHRGSCMLCNQGRVENRRETIIRLLLPAHRSHRCSFTTPPAVLHPMASM